MTVHIGRPLTFDQIVSVAAGETVALADGLAENMAASRSIVEEVVASQRATYGINTGLGDLANVRIDAGDARRLQDSILRSHATAVGPPLPTDVVRAMLLLKARTFAYGASGVRLELVERLAWMLNHSIHPVVPAQGSLGASGDLALLAHLALPLIGEGLVEVDARVMPATEALRAAGVEPLVLSHKEGLSLVNGTEGMLALGILSWVRSQTIAEAADVTAAMSVEAALGTDRAFEEQVIALRRHPGAHMVAGNLRGLLRGSAIVASHRDSEHIVQDAYSLRCIPQVHGAYRDALEYVGTTLQRELESSIDNPNVIVDSKEVLSAGNFHGEALGLAMDHLALCLAGFSTISERRIARLIDPDLSNGLPPFLTTDAGTRTGFMIAHYTAASLVGENRSLCWPASADSIPTSAGQEDHVSMGATAARKAAAILPNTEHVLAIEALTAAQALDLRAPLKPAHATGAARDLIRTVSEFLEEDRPLSAEIAEMKEMIHRGELARAAQSGTG